MRFVAVDVETANPDLASICQLGVVVFEADQVVEVWDTLIDPEDFFYFGNVDIHGIDEKQVRGAPNFPRVADKLGALLANQIVAHHGAFDRNAIAKVAAKYELPPIECRWLDTTRVARQTWTEFATSGYGLANIARSFGIAFKHHAAHEDARVAGGYFSGLSITLDWRCPIWWKNTLAPAPTLRPTDHARATQMAC